MHHRRHRPAYAAAGLSTLASVALCQAVEPVDIRPSFAPRQMRKKHHREGVAMDSAFSSNRSDNAIVLGGMVVGAFLVIAIVVVHQQRTARPAKR